MPRTPRSYLPGAVFHLTARTQGHTPWFTAPLRPLITEYMASSIRNSDAQLLAWAVMPNHLHMVLRQGALPLERVMHPLLTRVAVLAHKAHSLEGHVFERRFRDRPCMDPHHVRNAIVYTNLNPFRAGLTDGVTASLWSSHSMYAGITTEPLCMHGVLRAESGLRLFAHRDGLSTEALREAYRRYIEWRIERDRQPRGDERADPVSGPSAWTGATEWSRSFAPLFRDHTIAHDPTARPVDLREIAKRTMAELETKVPLEKVRSGCKEQTVVRARRAMVIRMSEAGHRGTAVARYLRVSPQCVSNILTSARQSG